MEDDKPFACPLPGCRMRFVNEDRLTVHKQTHELTLPITTYRSTTFFVDQTPTPSRFMMSALASELFQDELHGADNPFDATFRRANSLGAAASDISMPEPTILSTPSDTEPLNTPCIILPPEDQLPSISQAAKVIPLKPPVPRVKVQLKTGDSSAATSPQLPKAGASLPDTAKTISNVNSEQDKEADVSSTDLSLASREEKLTQALEQNIRDTVVQTPVIMSVGNHARVATGVPTAVVVTRAPSSNMQTLSTSINEIPVMAKSSSQLNITDNMQSISQTTTVAPVVQLLIRLPNGQSMPVALPVTVAATAAPTVSSAVTTDVNPFEEAPKSMPQSVTKKKLKEVLKSQQKKQPTTSTAMTSEDTAASMLLLNNFSLSQNDSESPPLSPVSVGRPGSNGRRRRAIDDPDERRRKSLERNRAAATRCRQKRKQWIMSLESKADEMAKHNTELQNEVTMLRNEVTQLKAMLLAHKDCPVTQQQKASGIPEVLRIVPVQNTNFVTQRQPIANSVPSTPIVHAHENNMDFMDMETSSSQSGYISDTSEVSTRER